MHVSTRALLAVWATVSFSAAALDAAAPAVLAVTLRRDSPWKAPAPEASQKLIDELKKDLPGDRFRIYPVGPWVVATDLPADEARGFVDSTLQIYAAKIQQQLFKTPRSSPVKVMLFADADSYTTWNVKLFGERPSTPFGYYSRARNAMVMNIGTGGGTLLHEMVHAMAEADWPGIPSWLNEGIGSLYEASTCMPSGKVFGVTNWRLRGLQKDLEAGTATKLADLLAMDTATFYGERSGANYATSRYLMQWLQVHGKFEAFYTGVRDREDHDAATVLRQVFEDKFSIAEIEKQLFAWVRTLKQP